MSAVRLLWELREEQVPWFETLRPKRIEATPALILVVVEPTAANAQARQEPFKEELRKLGRGIAQSAWDCGLARPVVLTLVEPDDSRRAALDELAADQEWHRGEFALWPVISDKDIDWLRQPTVEALHFDEQDPSDPSRRQTDEELVQEFVDSLGKHGKPHLEKLTKELFEQLKILRPNPDDGRELEKTDEDQLALLIGKWIEDQLLVERDRQHRDEAQEALTELHLPLKLTSYAPLPDSLHFDAQATQDERSQWRNRVEERLRRLRNTLLGRQSPVLEIEPRCTPAVAFFVGSIFHAATGVQLHVQQFNQGIGAPENWHRTPGQAAEPYVLKSRIREVGVGGAPTEVQIRISLAQDVAVDADTWTTEHDISAIALDLEASEISSSAVRNGDDAYAIARAVRREIVKLRRELAPQLRREPSSQLPLRFFYAGPIAVAFFIGAELNAMGRVYLMDLLKDEHKYVESFDVQPGK